MTKQHKNTTKTPYKFVMWRNIRFLHICHVEKFEITPHVEKSQISPHLSCTEIWNFSTWQIFSPRIYPWDPWQTWGMLIVMVCWLALTGALIVMHHYLSNFFRFHSTHWDFHSSLHHRATQVSPNYNNVINAIEMTIVTLESGTGEWHKRVT